VRIAELETELAFSALVQKLTEGGFVVHLGGSPERICRVELISDDDTLLIQILTNFAFSEWLYEHICFRLRATHPYLSDDEREYVSLLTFHGLRKTDDRIAGKVTEEWHEAFRGAVQRVIEGCANPCLNIDGVIRFRARAYVTAAETAIHEMVEQFLADREYEEFVSMLRYMLEAQPPTTQVLHVYCGDDRIWLTDEMGNLVKDTEVSRAAQQVSDDGDVNTEDLAMSILITRSPCSIIIHDLTHAPPWPSFAETLERVFLDRAVRCTQCTTCVALRKPEETGRAAEVNHQSAMPDEYE
jgi:putative sporulation protein YtxC